MSAQASSVVSTWVWLVRRSVGETVGLLGQERGLCAPLIQVLLGLWLIVGTKQVVRLVRRVRTFGVKTADKPPEA